MNLLSQIAEYQHFSFIRIFLITFVACTLLVGVECA